MKQRRFRKRGAYTIKRFTETLLTTGEISSDHLRGFRLLVYTTGTIGMVVYKIRKFKSTLLRNTELQNGCLNYMRIMSCHLY